MNVAWPEMRVFVPIGVAPSLKVTVPVGMPVPGAVAITVAVKVTACPKIEGLTDELTAVVVLALLTVCVKLDELLALKLPSPL
jgi:hypothetical protein